MTESEVRHGVLCEQNPEEHCFWISRNIRDLEDHLQDANAQSFIDISCQTREINIEAQDLLQVRTEQFNLRRLICCWKFVFSSKFLKPV